MADYMIEGACRFCGQMQRIKASEPLEGAEADNYVTQYCKCEDAVRMRARDALTGNIDSVLGIECANYGFEVIAADIIECIRNLAPTIMDGDLKRLDVTFGCGDKLTVKYNKRLEVTAVRTKAKVTLER